MLSRGIISNDLSFRQTRTPGALALSQHNADVMASGGSEHDAKQPHRVKTMHPLDMSMIPGCMVASGAMPTCKAQSVEAAGLQLPNPIYISFAQWCVWVQMLSD